jgi:peptidoglycan/xylan/chitin deacetylase (PgdA/CDA1 family)
MHLTVAPAGAIPSRDHVDSRVPPDFSTGFGGLEMRTTQAIKHGLFRVGQSTGLMSVVQVRFAARGVILVLHEVRDNRHSELMTGTTTELLRHVVVWLKKNGWRIVSLNEFLRDMVPPSSPVRLAAITFDDGYRDLVTHALPVLEENDVPFTVFVPTGAPTRNLYSWWLGLRTLFRTYETVTIEPMDRRFRCQGFREKVAALHEVEAWVNQDYHRTSMLEPTFTKTRVSFPALNEAYFLGEHELCELARHPLASIGAHTSSHAALALLGAEEARQEMAENRAYLENLLQEPVQHLAFPYGTPLACGDREAKLAADVGFLSSLTSRTEQFLTGRTYDQFFLPRVGIGSKDTRISFEIKLSGFQRTIDGIRRMHLMSSR